MDDIYIDRRGIGTAIDGDIVEVRLIQGRRRDGKSEGLVENVVERAHEEIVGQFMHQHKGGCRDRRATKKSTATFTFRASIRRKKYAMTPGWR